MAVVACIRGDRREMEHEKREEGLEGHSRSLAEIIEKNQLTAHFQPIVSLKEKVAFGYEALCRTVGENPFSSIEQLFLEAQKQHATLQLDMTCRQNSISSAARHGLMRLPARLFLNICPISLLHPQYSTGMTDELAERWGIDRERIVLEITEQEAVSNYSLFTKVIQHYQASGFKIAIDDFGAGYGGLKMLSILEPDFVKIDRHFFRDSEKKHVNYNLIDAVVTACNRIGIEVIAEGIETEEDVRICHELGIDLLQGYHFARPQNGLVSDSSLVFPDLPERCDSATNCYDEILKIGDIVQPVSPVHGDERALDALQRFYDHRDLVCLPVVRCGSLAGFINRHRFMENHMVGRFGYGLSLNFYKLVEDVMDRDFLQVAEYETVEEVSRKIQQRPAELTYDDICVTRSGRYIGMVSVRDVLNAVTENSMMMARGANPLTGLPGNEGIQRAVARLLSQSVHFEVCYIDIDCFKPFNDSHGFEKGDRVIKALATIVTEVFGQADVSGIGFVGHIGGDDFIAIARPRNSVEFCREVIRRFEDLQTVFHSQQACRDGFYTGRDRDGRLERFGLLSVSIGIVSTEIHSFQSFAELSSIASDLKKRAKSIPGSSLVRDRRSPEKTEKSPSSLSSPTGRLS